MPQVPRIGTTSCRTNFSIFIRPVFVVNLATFTYFRGTVRWVKIAESSLMTHKSWLMEMTHNLWSNKSNKRPFFDPVHVVISDFAIINIFFPSTSDIQFVILNFVTKVDLLWRHLYLYSHPLSFETFLFSRVRQFEERRSLLLPNPAFWRPSPSARMR